MNNNNRDDSPDLYFEQFIVGNMKLVVKYTPRGRLDGTNYARIVVGNGLWIMALIPLDNATFTLAQIELQDVDMKDLPIAIFGTWMPNLWKTHIPQYLKGVQPIRIMARMGSGVFGLVRVPLEQYHREGNANILAGLGEGIQTLTVEVLNFGSRVTVSAHKILRKTERLISGIPGRLPNQQKISSWADQPNDFREGASQGLQVLLDALGGAAEGILSRPWDGYEKNGGLGFMTTFLRGLPGCVLQPVIGVTGAVSKLTLGLRNSLDSKEKAKAEYRYKKSEEEEDEDDEE